MKKFLIIGLGNPGSEYSKTRHNIGFEILDYISSVRECKFETVKLADITKFKDTFNWSPKISFKSWITDLLSNS